MSTGTVLLPPITIDNTTWPGPIPALYTQGLHPAHASERDLLSAAVTIRQRRLRASSRQSALATRDLGHRGLPARRLHSVGHDLLRHQGGHHRLCHLLLRGHALCHRRWADAAVADAAWRTLPTLAAMAWRGTGRLPAAAGRQRHRRDGRTLGEFRRCRRTGQQCPAHHGGLVVSVR